MTTSCIQFRYGEGQTVRLKRECGAPQPDPKAQPDGIATFSALLLTQYSTHRTCIYHD